MGKRADHRETTEAAILAAALKLLAEGGEAALTVRGVARELSLVPSALYRYVRSRGDLLRILIAHVHDDLADEVEKAQAAVPVADLRGRWRAFAHSLRRWALAHPQEWRLIMGAPSPDYSPPADHTFAPGARIHLLLLRIGVDLEAAGIQPARARPPARTAIPGLAAYVELGGVAGISEPTALAGLAGWHLLDGAVYAELFRLTGMDMVDPDAYYDAMVAASEVLLFGPQA